MRELKFRQLENGEWKYILLVNGLARPEPIFQFTGLLDKNGKEIYEGDILETSPQKEHPDFIGFRTAVEFRDGMFCFDPLEEGDRRHALSMILDYGVEVIGNIYESQGLLGGTPENPDMLKNG